MPHPQRTMADPVDTQELTPGQQFEKLVQPYVERRRAEDEEKERAFIAMRDHIQGKVEIELKAALARGTLNDDGNTLRFSVLLTPEEHEWILKDSASLVVCASSIMRARLGITNPSIKLITPSYCHDTDSKNWQHHFKMFIRC